ncbi:MAG: DUF2309 domain-containing protein [Planctomycetaceae bacterium]|nr:DUF2309 domain-containing protein [Planctomycetaceae bacterium]
MPEVIETGDIAVDAAVVWADVVRVADQIPPLWGLENYVAVNPFLGFAGEPVAEVARAVADGLGGRVLPGTEYYREQWATGMFERADLASAARGSGCQIQTLEAILQGERPMPTRPSTQVLTFAEQHDRRHGTDWNGLFIRSAARWCAVHASGGGTHWPLPCDPRGLFASWRDAAASDRSLEIAGVRGFRTWIGRIPDDPAAAIVAALTRVPVTGADREAYLYRLLGGLFGWASYFRRETWAGEADAPGELADLLAIRICQDAAAAAQSGRTTLADDVVTVPVEAETVRVVFQDALENGYARRLISQLRAAPSSQKTARPAVQAVFCIDVRSEPFRRHLETQSQEIETRGFAGFFGVALNWQADGNPSARCPVLLKPGVTLEACGCGSGRATRSLKQIQVAPAAAFSYVELLGVAYSLGLAGDALAASRANNHGECLESFDLEPDARGRGLTPAARLDLAAGILKNMGFGTSFARLVLLCGHESQSTNNPHAAGLDCGACGGHGGGVNARVAAAVLNDTTVRAGLPARGWVVPADTHFVPGVHNTSTDEVRLLHLDRIPTDLHADLKRLREWLAAAGAATRAERAPALGLGGKPAGVLSRLLGRRTRDWSEVRPEWGLARNAAFIAARRCRTRGIDLQGRAFLHEYDAAADTDASVLTLILSAPMVVASWINLQYFASTVDNDVFGCGDKALHNRVGALGVVLGNGGDLRTGLPLQSVHAGNGRWFHEPLRLQVVVEAPTDRIDRVLAAQPGVRELIENGWVRLFALNPDGTETSQRVPGHGWERVNAEEERGSGQPE